MAKSKSNTKRAARAGVYIRMSSDQQERSPAQQRAEIAKLAKRAGHQIVAEFVDEVSHCP